MKFDSNRIKPHILDLCYSYSFFNGYSAVFSQLSPKGFQVLSDIMKNKLKLDLKFRLEFHSYSENTT
jgi:hypothetical protein